MIKYLFLFLIPFSVFAQDQITIIETSSSTPIEYTIKEGNIQKFKVTKDCNYTKFSMDANGNQYIHCGTYKIRLNTQ